VILVEAGPRILPAFSEELSQRAQEQLEALGIEIRTGVPVSDLGSDYVAIGGERIGARTVVWAAGLQASPLTRDLGAELDRAGRVLVEDDLSLPGRPEVFAVGDLISKQQNDKPLPGVAQLALQSGEHAAKNIARSLHGLPRQAFAYVDKGSMATIGRNKAVAQIGRVQFSGFIAWLLWLTVHILFLVEVRRRLQVLSEWAWAYVTWHRGSRLIVDVPSDQPNTSAPLAKRPPPLTASRTFDAARLKAELAAKQPVLQSSSSSTRPVPGTRSTSSI
jgi:NADH dehydrogenase